MTIAIRRPGPEEALAFATLHVTCWSEAYRGIVPAAILERAVPEGRLAIWRGVLADPGRIAFGACDDNEPVGFILAGPPLDALTDDIDGHVYALYVRASHQRQGIGRRLMGAAAKAWLGQGGTSLTLGVLEDNTGARRFYEALGGAFLKAGAYEWDGQPLRDAIYVFRDLPALAKSSALSAGEFPIR